MGQFVHAIRRNLNILYIIMNNGCYGLTKGQDSATADAGWKSTEQCRGISFRGIDLCGLGLELGATFVAQKFSGTNLQFRSSSSRIDASGFCADRRRLSGVTFNNNAGSTKIIWLHPPNMEATAAIDLGTIPRRDPFPPTGSGVLLRIITSWLIASFAVNKLPARLGSTWQIICHAQIAQASFEHEILHRADLRRYTKQRFAYIASILLIHHWINWTRLCCVRFRWNTS